MTKPFSLDNVHVDDLLSALSATPGAELRIAAEQPLLVVAAEMSCPVSADPLTSAQVVRLCSDVLTDAQIAEYEAQGELRFVYSHPRRGEFQAHYRRTPAGLAATFQQL